MQNIYHLHRNFIVVKFSNQLKTLRMLGQMSKQQDVCCKALHENILLLQRFVRKLRLLTPSRYPAIISNLLPVIAPHLPCCVGNLASMLAMHPSNVSRVISALVDLGCLSVHEVPTDARRRSVSFTEKGVGYLNELIEFDKRQEERILACLSSAERRKLCHFFASLNDIYAVLPEIPLPGESAFIAEQKTLARALGMLGNNYLNSGVDLEVVHILYVLHSAKGLVASGDLFAVLPLDRSSISRQLAYLEEQNFVERKINIADRRMFSVGLTPHGEEYYAKLSSTCASFFLTAVNRLSVDQIRDFLKISAKLLNQPCIVG